MAGEHLDLTSDPGGGDPAEKVTRAWTGRGVDARRFVGVTFACCGVYARVYVNQDQSAYEGKCPRCAKPVTLTIGPSGTNSRFFTAY